MKLQDISTAYDLTTGRGRLRYLADEVLARVTREELPFDLEHWFERNGDASDCGTAACACGWAARDPLLRDQGLGWIKVSESTTGLTVDGFFDIPDSFFGLDFMTFGRLFMISAYKHNPTAADVADRIRAHLAETAE